MAYVRFFFLSVLGCVAILTVHPKTVRSGGAPGSLGLHTIPLVQQDVDPVTRIIDRLSDPQLIEGLLAGQQEAHVEVQVQLGRLGAYRESPVAIHELIRWLDFRSPPEYALAPESASFQEQLAFEEARHRKPTSFQETIPHPIRDYPAVQSLIRMGPVVSQYLVDDYAETFRACADLRLRRMHPRLLHIEVVLTHDHRLAPPAVVYALKRLADEKDATARHAYQTLIDEVVGEFPPAKRAELFPPEALKK
ncbi:MAG: hypothetical protein K2P78_01345 [Gemmataceae bacterium]|nr:hypothetical protein [Gemmataceae bacterium]